MMGNSKPGDSTGLQFTQSPCIKYVKSPLLVMGSERRGVNDSGWDGEQATGKRHVIAFSLNAIEVEFVGEQSILLAPPTVAFTRPEIGYTRTPQNARGQRTIFLSLNTQTAVDLCATRDPSARDRSDPFPARFGPCSAKALAMAVQLERLVFNQDSYTEALVFEEYSMQIVEHTLDAIFQACGSRLRPTAAARSHRESVDRVLGLICDNPSRKWALGELASAVDLSPAYLSRIFRKHSGRTLSQSVLLIRIVHALEQLPDRRRDLTGLALDCGFGSHSHMTSAFASILGVSPKQFVGGSHKSIRDSIDGIHKHLERLRWD